MRDDVEFLASTIRGRLRFYHGFEIHSESVAGNGRPFDFSQAVEVVPPVLWLWPVVVVKNRRMAKNRR